MILNHLKLAEIKNSNASCDARCFRYIVKRYCFKAPHNLPDDLTPLAYMKDGIDRRPFCVVLKKCTRRREYLTTGVKKKIARFAYFRFGSAARKTG